MTCTNKKQPIIYNMKYQKAKGQNVDMRFQQNTRYTVYNIFY